MEKRRIDWQEEALLMIDEYITWYRYNMGIRSSQKFLDSIVENVERISKSPTIGRCELNYTMQDLTIRSVLIYKHYRILYGYNEKQLLIIALWDVRSIMQK